ncbi:TetR/AcrR family transcriptional regulator [Hydrogenimonas sp.]
MKESKKEKILLAAAKLFSSQGYDAASLEEIAKDAGVSKAAIYYHFKDKAALYEAVLLFRLDMLAGRIETAVGEARDCEDKIRCYIETFGNFLAEYRCFAAILAHEFADDGVHMSDKAAARLATMLGIVTDILNHGIKERVFAMENPMVVQMTIVSTLIMHQTTSATRKRVTALVRGDHAIPPEPEIGDLARILANKIIKSIKKDGR